MFICEECDVISTPRQRTNRVVTKIRDKVYKHEVKTKPTDIIKFRYSYGWEIVKEKLVCNKCFDKLFPIYEELISKYKNIGLQGVQNV